MAGASCERVRKEQGGERKFLGAMQTYVVEVCLRVYRERQREREILGKRLTILSFFLVKCLIFFHLCGL